MAPTTVAFVLVLVALFYLWVHLLQLGRKHNKVVNFLEGCLSRIERLETSNNELFIYIATLENRIKELKKEIGE